MLSARHGKRGARLASRIFGASMTALAAAASAALYAGCSAEAAAPDTRALERAFPAEVSAVLDYGEGFAATGDGFIAAGEGSAASAPPAIGGFRPLEVELPRAGDGVIRLRTSGGFEARVREIGASGQGAIVNRAVVYQRAGRTSYWTAAQDKAEEWLHIDGPRGGAAAAWEVSGGAIEQRGDHVAIVDGAGVARLWVSAPNAYEAGGRPVRATLSARGTKIELSVETDADEVLIDPAWAATPPMSAAREGHTATPLSKGRVLVVGGRSGMSYPGTAEVYVPESNAWQTLQSMITGRADLTATALENGDVLIAGGFSGAATQSAYVFSAATDTFSLTGLMVQARARHTATRLGNGTVLIAGGDSGMASLSSSEIYDPSSGSFMGALALNAARASHTATRLGDGRVLVAGGVSGATSLATAEIYNPGTGEWDTASSLTAARHEHTATLLYDGRVLVAGGKSGATSLATAEVYEPGTDAWTPVTSMANARSGHAAATLANGRVLVTGGRDGAAPIASAEMYDPALDRWISAGSMTEARERHTATPLPNGKVLIAGGSKAGGVALSGAELHEPLLLGTACSAAADCLSGFCADGVCCKEECSAGPCDACSVAAGSDSDGACKLLSGKTCDDNNKCTTKDTCNAGVCAGEAGPPCPDVGPCRIGVCDPATGMCSTATAPDGYDCSDTDICTRDDTCDKGACVGKPVVCTAFDICHDAGKCDVLTGMCTNPEKDICELPDDRPEPPVLPKDVKTCANKEDCSSNFCVDGVCCDTECDDPCFTCVLPGAIGTCSLQPFGIDIHGDCGGPRSCKLTCSGVNHIGTNMPPCVDAEAGTQCSPSECFEDGFHGAGPSVCSAYDTTCPTGDRVPFNCSPYRCISAIGACSARCNTPEDCAPAFVCNPEGQCVLPPSISSGYVTSCAFAPPAAPESAGGQRNNAREGALALLIAGLSLTRRRRPVPRALSRGEGPSAGSPRRPATRRRAVR